MALLMTPVPVEVTRKGPLTFRAWSSAATRRANRRAKRVAELFAEAFLWLDQRVSFPKPLLPETEHIELDIERIKEIATACRRQWGLGDRPILKLGELLESQGLVVGSATFGDNRFDAFSCIVNSRPFIFLGDEKKDRARSRFDAAHELGHLVLHQHLSEVDFLKPDIHRRIEGEANCFASAFLMPAETFRLDILDTSLNGFLKIKSKWAVSVQAMVRWSYDLGLISKAEYEELFRQMGIKGWRRPKGEPLDDFVPEITGTLGGRGLALLQESGLIQSSEIPSELPLPTSILCSVFQREADHFKPDNIVRLTPDTETLPLKFN